MRRAARLSADVTHNHPEGIKGAESTASAIFLARTGHSKDAIRAYIEKEFGYALDRTCDQIRPTYQHMESCMETVPEAITAFLEGDSFEDVIRTAVSLGGDCDTLTAIAGSIAEGFYGVPEELKEARGRLPEHLRDAAPVRASSRAIGQKAEKGITAPGKRPAYPEEAPRAAALLPVVRNKFLRLFAPKLSQIYALGVDLLNKVCIIIRITL